MNKSLKIDCKIDQEQAQSATEEAPTPEAEDTTAEESLSIKVPTIEVHKLWKMDSQCSSSNQLASKAAASLDSKLNLDPVLEQLQSSSYCCPVKERIVKTNYLSVMADVDNKIPQIKVNFDEHKSATMPKGQNLMKSLPNTMGMNQLQMNQFEDSTQASSTNFVLSPNTAEEHMSLENTLKQLEQEGFNDGSPKQGLVWNEELPKDGSQITINCLKDATVPLCGSGVELASTKSIVSTCGTSNDRGSDLRARLDVSGDYPFMMTECHEAANPDSVVANEQYPTPKLNVKIKPLSTLKRDNSDVVVNVDFSQNVGPHFLAMQELKPFKKAGFDFAPPKIDINLAQKMTRPAKLLEMDQILDNLSMQFNFDKKTEGTKEWLTNDGLIRPLAWQDKEMMQAIEESDEEAGDSDFERDETDAADDIGLELMAPIPLQRQRGQIFRTFDVAYALG